MTSGPAAPGPVDTTGHILPDTLADLAEGLLAPTAADLVRDHLAGCDRCADDFAHITLDSGLAAFLPPEPIPAEVVARVEAALYREPPLRPAGAPGTEPAGASATGARSRRARRFRIAFGAVGALGVLGVGGFAIGSALHGGSTSKGSAASGVAARPDVAPVPGSTYAPGGMAAGPADLAAARQQAAELLAGLKPTSGGTAASGTKQEPLVGSACARGPKPDQTLLASAATTFDSRPAVLFVYADPADPRRAVVVVTTAGCPAATLGETDVTRP